MFRSFCDTAVEQGQCARLPRRFQVWDFSEDSLCCINLRLLAAAHVEGVDAPQVLERRVGDLKAPAHFEGVDAPQVLERRVGDQPAVPHLEGVMPFKCSNAASVI